MGAPWVLSTRPLCASPPLEARGPYIATSTIEIRSPGAESAVDHHGCSNRLAVPASGRPSGSHRGGGGRASIELFDCGRVCLQQHGWCPFCAKRDDTDSAPRGRRSWSNEAGAISTQPLGRCRARRALQRASCRVAEQVPPCRKVASIRLTDHRSWSERRVIPLMTYAYRSQRMSQRKVSRS